MIGFSIPLAVQYLQSRLVEYLPNYKADTLTGLETVDSPLGLSIPNRRPEDMIPQVTVAGHLTAGSHRTADFCL